jgi:hypothetical protein
MEALGDILISLLFQVVGRKYIATLEDRELRSLSMTSNSSSSVVTFYRLSALLGLGITFSIFKAGNWVGRTVRFHGFPL